MQEEFDPIQIEEAQVVQPKKSHVFRNILIALICVTIVAVAAALLVKEYVVTTYICDGISMYPTLDGGAGSQIEGKSEEELLNGEVLYLNRIASIKRGDIVVFDCPALGQVLVKRVIAIAGDRLQIIDNVVYLNGEVLEEDYINNQLDSMQGNADLDITIGEGQIFCMGDNRNHSTDSRYFGAVSLDSVIGKCFMVKGLDGKFRFV